VQLLQRMRDAEARVSRFSRLTRITIEKSNVTTCEHAKRPSVVVCEYLKVLQLVFLVLLTLMFCAYFTLIF
jgi:hypothetical protein